VASTSRKSGGALFAILSLVALLVIIGVVLVVAVPQFAPSNPFSGRALYVDPRSSAALAAADASGEEAAAFTTLADTPTAIWLLPEEHPAAEITSYVALIEADAAAKSELPVFVVYGIPSRDCGNFSAGGTEAREYPLWISAIATGNGDNPTVIILEPDSIALSPDCGTEQVTADFLNDAIGRFTGSNTAIYLDGGHSNWLPADTMAPLLTAAGVSRVRGFATNVSNYNSTDREREYGQQLSSLLNGAHFVVDVSRNAKGTNGQWCNPDGRGIGVPPSGVDDGTPQDANLWIKKPGESDGECNGGPPAGVWWPFQALELVRGGS
jgi:endoglucanase